ncbi:MAG: ABC transporter permease [Actinomycetota bacterium]
MKRSPLLITGAAILSALILAAVLAPFLAPYDPHALVGDSLGSPSGRHLLGTNNIGQDILSQLIWGARETLAVVVAAASLSVAGAVLAGVVPALIGGWTDIAAARLIDLLLAIPGLPLVLLVATLAGPSRPVLIFVIAFAGLPGIARILRSETKTLRTRGFVGVAQGFGGGRGYVVRRHLIPGLTPVIVTRFVEWAGIAVFLQAGLAFLGLADPTQPSWGLMLNRAIEHPGLYFSSVWTWWVLPAGFAVTLAVLGFTLVGVGLETTLNPRVASHGESAAH